MELTSIVLTAAGANARAAVDGPLTSGMVGLPVTIEYDGAWDGLTKNLVCRCSKWGPDRGETRTVLNVDDSATVAHEVMQADMHLYLGIEGCDPDGTLVMPTVWADCGLIRWGAEAGADPSADPGLPVWNQLRAEIDGMAAAVRAAEAAIAEWSLNSGGVSKTARSLLVSILRGGVYASDRSADITALETALMSQGGGNGTAAYTVVNRLSGVTTSNRAESIGADEAYSATLAVVEGYQLKTVTVTMGGRDITSSAWDAATSAITISSVTGDLVIAAAAEARQAEILQIVRTVSYPDITTFAYEEGRNSNDQYTVAQRSTLAGGVLSVAFDTAAASNFDMNLFLFDESGEPCKHTYNQSGTASGVYEPQYADPGSGSGFFKCVAPFTLVIPTGCTVMANMRKGSACTGTAAETHSTFTEWVMAGGITFTVTN